MIMMTKIKPNAFDGLCCLFLDVKHAAHFLTKESYSPAIDAFMKAIDAFMKKRF